MVAQHPQDRIINNVAEEEDEDAAKDCLIVANAFRQASDEDVIQALDLCNQSISRLLYYPIATSWLRQAWPFINSYYQHPRPKVPRNWKEIVGPIPDISISMIQHQQHGVDYCLIGANAWLLLQQKFGTSTASNTTTTTPACTVRRHNENNIWVVVVSETQWIDIPLQGRFPYEKYIDKVVNMEIEPIDNIQYRHNQEKNPQEFDDDDDLFPGVVDSAPDPAQPDMEQGDSQIDEQPIIMLPPSTSNRDFAMRDVTSDTTTTLRLVRRRNFAGLGNLGNTCFMNSTLQCLAHTEPLRRYFLSGDFQNDLNRDNPLGTGGELATQFAFLLAEMCSSKERVPHGSLLPTYASQSSNITDTHSSMDHHLAVYPRKFKETVGKHAEQFLGYDQHDSQEFATYLLDALHEDCNRVTQKPYVEKPEQAEDETDEQAASKAWELQLRREDSRVLEQFMGQVKSRVQCSTPGCGRVSTTFDPFMFLSVPLPGFEDRILTITYIPKNPNRRPVKLRVKVSKSATIEELVKEVTYKQLPKIGLTPPAIDDVALCDIWQHYIFNWRDLKNGHVEDIQDRDETIMYELRSLAEVQKLEEDGKAIHENSDDMTADNLGIRDMKRPKQYILDIATMTRLNQGDAWQQELEKYLEQPLTFTNAFNPRKGKSEDRARIYRRLLSFIDQCHNAIKASEEEATSSRSQRRKTYHDIEKLPINDNEECSSNGEGKAKTSLGPDDHKFIREVMDRCDVSQFFKNVQSKHDIAVLEFLTGKVYRQIIELERQRRDVYPNGLLIEVRFRKGSESLASPLVLRITSDITVFDLRKLLAERLSRCFKQLPDHDAVLDTASCYNEKVDTHPVSAMNGDATTDDVLCNGLGSPALLVFRKVHLAYERKGVGAARSCTSFKQLGSMPKAGSLLLDGTVSGRRASSSVEPNHPEEKELVADAVGDLGVVFVDLTDDLIVETFDETELTAVDVPAEIQEYEPENNITVLDCIDKFCQMEQLEESEQWYCSKCKSHVCAWKQFHIYRSPQILIVHLKRFQYTNQTHRRKKICAYVDFPLVGLDLSEHVLHWSEEEKPLYDCYSVSNHIGGLGGGHYTAYCLNDEGEWCLYDDTRVKINIDPSEVVSEEAYVLYYRRRDVLVGQDFEMKLLTPEIVTAGPTLVTDSLITDNVVPANDRVSELSSSVNMVVEEEVDDNFSNSNNNTVMDLSNMYPSNISRSTPQDDSGSTSPVSDHAVQDDDEDMYSYETDHLTPGGSDNGSNTFLLQ